MIKVKITKNIIRKTNNSLGIGVKEIITAVVAAVIGVFMYFALKNIMSVGNLMMLIFVVLATIIGFGCINVQGQSLFEYFIKVFKGADVRPYVSKGVFNNYVEPTGKSDRKKK